MLAAYTQPGVQGALSIKYCKALIGEQYICKILYLDTLDQNCQKIRSSK